MTDVPDDHAISVLADCAGLNLPQAYLAELADAYRHVYPILLRLRRGRPYADEPAQVFIPARFNPVDA